MKESHSRVKSIFIAPNDDTFLSISFISEIQTEEAEKIGAFSEIEYKRGMRGRNKK